MDILCRPAEVNCVVQQTLDLFEQQLKDHNIRVVAEPGNKLPAVFADADKLKQVFINLIGNAIDAITQGGEIRIGATVENDADGRPMVVVRFRDSGSGMPGKFRPGSSTPSSRPKRTAPAWVCASQRK